MQGYHQEAQRKHEETMREALETIEEAQKKHKETTREALETIKEARRNHRGSMKEAQNHHQAKRMQAFRPHLKNARKRNEVFK